MEQHVPFPLQMPRYYRRRPYRRPYSVSFRFGRSRRRFNRQVAGALQQRDSARFVIKTQQTGFLEIETGETNMAISIPALTQLENSTLMARLRQCFDQVKVNAIRVRIIPTSVATPAGAYMQSVIAWDRNGADQNLNFTKAASYGSAKVNYFNPSSKTTLTHTIAAETIGEKTQYLNSVDLGTDAFAWRPILILGLQAPGEVQQGENFNANIVIEWTFDLTFRGTRLQ